MSILEFAETVIAALVVALTSSLVGCFLWLILFRSALVPHLVWFCKYRKEEPAWDKAELEAWILERYAERGGVYGFLHKLWTCPVCQSIHCGWAPVVFFYLLLPISIPTGILAMIFSVVFTHVMLLDR